MTDAERYKLLYELSCALHEQRLDWQRTLQTIISLAGTAVQAKHGCLMTFADSNTIDNVVVLGADEDDKGIDATIWQTLLRRGLVGYVYHSDRTVNIRNIRNDPRWTYVPDADILPVQGSAISIPLSKGSYIYGALLLIHPEIDYFNRERTHLLEEIAVTSSPAIGNALELKAARSGDIRYHAVFDGAVVPIVLTDMRGFIVDVNHKACDFLGYSRSDLVRVPLADINVVKLDDEQLRELRDLEETSFYTTTYDADGSAIPSLVRARVVQLEGRKLIEWVMQDMTTQAELEQLKRDLAAMVYHDLRGPLQGIVGSIYKLGSVLQNHDNPAVLKLLHIGLQSTRRLQRMVDSLLDIQRMEEGNAMLNRQPVEARVLVADAVQIVQPLAQESGQRIVFEVERDVPVAFVDNEMLMRVLINLMENAVKYTPSDGIIHVTAAVDNGQVLFKVSDAGPGIPPEMLGRIFDKFSRVKHQDAPKGVGLGLAFCRLAVEAHGGKIWVESELGHGAQFIFRVPLDDPKRVNDPDRVTQEVKRATA